MTTRGSKTERLSLGLLLGALAFAAAGCDEGSGSPRATQERVMFEPDGLLLTAERNGNAVIGRVYSEAGAELNQTSTEVDALAADATKGDEESLLRLGAAEAFANYVDDQEDAGFRATDDPCGVVDLSDECTYFACEDEGRGVVRWCIECNNNDGTSTTDCFDF